jgi:7-carboxy-7-deazaguanine synthase
LKKPENAARPMKLQRSEIFYSLQGEGQRAGSANIFIRTQGCKAQQACYAMGIKCDTEFESGKEYTLEDLLKAIQNFDTNCKSIIWTGGEPAQQITDEIVRYFKEKGYYQCIETSGLFAVSSLLDYVVVSPKVAEHVVKKNFPNGASELRYVRHKGQEIPNPSITAKYYYISPHSDGWTINTENLLHCVELCKKHPQWRLSVQQHKIWSVL